MEANLFESINKIYRDKSYFELYGVDLIITFFIIYFILLATTYFYILTYKKNIQIDWSNKRCNPLYLPISGFIVKKNNQTATQATGENFHYCTRNILTTITNEAFAPIYYLFNVLNSISSQQSGSINSVRGMFNKVRTNIGNTASNISDRTLNVSMPIVHQAINSRDTLSRIHGIATTVVYQLFGLFITTFSLFRFFKNVLVGLLVIMAAAIVALWILSFVPFVGIPAGIAAGTSTLLYIAILVPFLIVIILISIIFKYKGGRSPPSIPGRPSCFDKNTNIEMNDGSIKKISDIMIGDILKDNNKVTATIKSAIGKNKMYKINDILVTGSHKMLINNNWIKASEYDKSILINDYSEEIVYCLNTENKLINIQEFIFMDWDELDFDEVKILQKNNKYDINKTFNNGIIGNTLLNTENGNKLIKDINIGDNLGNENYVLAVMKVLPDNLHVINKCLDKNKSIILTLNLLQDTSFIVDDNIKCNELYQLKTTKGYYYIFDFKINDYDSIIEKILQ